MNRRQYLAACAAVGIAGCAGGDSGGSSDGSSGGGDGNSDGGNSGGGGQSTATETPEPTPTATPTPSGPPTHQVGESFTVGDGARSVRYTVQETGTAQEVGADVVAEEADGTFLLVSLTLENVGDESFNVSSNLFQAVNAEDQSYDVDTEALTVLGDSALIFEQVNPGLSTEGQIVFDVPAGEYRLRVEPAGFASTASAHVVELGSV